MSKLNEVLQEFRDFLTVKLDKDVKLAQMELDNGTIIEAEVFEAGASVFIVSEEGNVPLPVGEYPMADGMMLNVAEEGVIESISEAKAEEEEMSKPEFVTVDDFNSAISEIKSMLSKEQESHKEEVENLAKEKEELSKQAEELQKTIDETPDAKPIVAAPIELKAENLNKVGRILQKIRQ